MELNDYQKHQLKLFPYHQGVLLYLTKKYGINNQLFVSCEELDTFTGSHLLCAVDPEKGVTITYVPKEHGCPNQ